MLLLVFSQKLTGLREVGSVDQCWSWLYRSLLSMAFREFASGGRVHDFVYADRSVFFWLCLQNHNRTLSTLVMHFVKIKLLWCSTCRRSSIVFTSCFKEVAQKFLVYNFLDLWRVFSVLVSASSWCLNWKRRRRFSSKNDSSVLEIFWCFGSQEETKLFSVFWAYRKLLVHSFSVGSDRALSFTKPGN